NQSSEQGTALINYTVQKGESLSTIAEKFNISVETILLANELSSSKIIAGQELVILPTSGLIHMVSKGETVKAIALKYGAQEQEIISFNNLPENGQIYVGDVLIVPGGKAIQKPTSAPQIQDVADNSTAPTGQISLPGAYFVIPTTGIISQRAHFSYVSDGRSYYNSIDIANAIGTPVVAAAGGTIEIAKNAWPYGNYITIAHPNGVVTLYAHLSSIAKGVYAGVSVSQGQIIGYMGNTGRVVSTGGTGSHLHFETRGTTNPLAGYTKGSKVVY
ncbi:MAG: M23 family metallopeptidase, partial [Candidatus Pacebacteria bacterium]|nr:M23 family metallopeptidase [Candidatus Paceibacterota bacterium]